MSKIEYNGSAPVLIEMPVTNLATALANAQKSVGQLATNKENKHGGYKYVSADAVVGAANKALAENGLAFRCVSSVYGVSEEIPVIKFKYKLTHGASGETEEIETECAYVVRNGMPADKAAFVARTTDLSYTLKSLLLIERGEEADDASARDDSKFTPVEPADSVEVTAILARISAVTSVDEVSQLTADVKASGLGKHPKVRAAYAAKTASLK